MTPEDEAAKLEALRAEGLPVGPDEANRLKALRATGLMEGPDDPVLDALLAEIAETLGVAMVALTLIDHEKQWFKSAYNLTGRQTSRQVSFCQYTVLGEHVLEVENTLEDPRFRHNVFVIAEPKIRFYAGAPLVTADGYALGSLCVFDRAPRRLTGEERRRLEGYRDAAEVRLGLRARPKG